MKRVQENPMTFSLLVRDKSQGLQMLPLSHIGSDGFDSALICVMDPSSSPHHPGWPIRFELLRQKILSTSSMADQDPLRRSRPLAQRVASKRRPGGRAQDDRQRGQDHCGSQSCDLRPTTGCVFRNIILT